MPVLTPESVVRIVLDTNIIVSASIRPDGVPARILALGAEGKFRIVISPFIISELERVLAEPKIGWSEDRIRQAVVSLREIVEIVTPKVKVDVIQAEEADNRILECAVDAKAEVLVTGNMKHIRPLGSWRGIAILTPREFLDKYFPVS